MPPIPSAPESYIDMLVVAALRSSATAPVALTGANAVLVHDVQFTPLEADRIQRAYVQPHLGSRKFRNARTRQKINFGLELCGLGAGAIASNSRPPHDAFLQAAGFVPTVRPSTAAATIGALVPGGGNTGTLTIAKTTAFAGLVTRTVTLTCTTGGASSVNRFTISGPGAGPHAAVNTTNVPLTDATPVTLANGAQITPTVGTAFTVGDTFTITLFPPEVGYRRSSDRNNHGLLDLWYYRSDKYHPFLAARGNGALKFEQNKHPMLMLSDVTSFYAALVEAAQPVPDYTDWTEPPLVSTANTPFFKAFGQELVMSSFEVAFGNEVVATQRVGRQAVRIKDFSGTVNYTIEEPDPSDANFFARAEAATEGTVEFMHGTAQGEVIHVEVHQHQVSDVRVSEEDGDAMLAISGGMYPSPAGDDEIVIAFR